MEIRVVLMAALVCGLVCGCKEEAKEAVCQDYAPADAEISWTEYNSIGAVHNYFDCHWKTKRRHEILADTVLVWGYIRPQNGGYDYLYDIIDSVNERGRYDEGFYIARDTIHNDRESVLYLVPTRYWIDETGIDLNPLVEGGGYKKGQKVYVRTHILSTPVIVGCCTEILGTIIDVHK